ncbi:MULTISPECIES: hypothetical protein [Pseudomonas]|uniref:hypothetical protein n=1 Tax=Pseudomonas TaxID=286 RepID=UPI0011B69E81|nr:MULTISPECIES: hypothetical protein [Pseudomonas]
MKKLIYISAGLLTVFLFLGVLALQTGILGHGSYQPAPAPAPESLPPDLPEEPPHTDDFLAADRALEELRIANIAFNAPQKINIEDSTKIQLFLSLSNSSEELISRITAPGTQESASIRVSKEMEARLTGTNFSISAIKAERQMVTGGSTTEWEWVVQPKNEGSSTLYLTLTAIVDVNGTSVQKAIRTFDREIEVEVTLQQTISSFLKTNWQWLWAAILIPLAGWGIKAIRTKPIRRTPD